MDEKIISSAPGDFFRIAGEAWPGMGEKLFSQFRRDLAADAGLIRRAAVYAINNAKVNGREQADLADLYFGMLVESRNAKPR